MGAVRFAVPEIFGTSQNTNDLSCHNGFATGVLRDFNTAVMVAEIIKFVDKGMESPMFHDLLYGILNRAIGQPRTSTDFLSRDSKKVEKYLHDPFCGCTVT